MTPHYTRSPRRWRSHRPSRYSGFPSYHRRRSRLVSALIIVSVVSAVLGIGAMAIAVAWVSRALPDPDRIITRQVAESTKIYDRTGAVLLYEIHGGEKRTRIKLDALPSHVKWATIVAEDDSFYQHGGIDIKSIIRAVLVDIFRGGKVQGGSTITQQFIKNSVLTSEKTYARKLKELILAFEIERRFSKDQILEMYLNEIGYGGATYGIEAASNYYFGKSAKEATIVEAALLASLPKAPTYYSPYGKHRDELLGRQTYILKRLYEKQYITQDEYERAKKDATIIQSRQENLKAPHFVLWIRDQLMNTYGEKLLQEGGLKVTTTLDWDKQQIAEEAIAKAWPKNQKEWKAKNAALVALETATGQVLAMVGSRDYFDTKNDGNVNVALRPRQPGSSFKPIVYSAAFEKGYTPDTIVFDVLTEFNPNCSPEANEEKDVFGLQCYHPQNYTETFRGPITLKEALAQSINVPAVKILYLSGVPETIELARKLGIESLGDASQYGLSLVLGGGEVTLLEETSAYSTFATRGMYTPPVAVLTIDDSSGNKLFQSSPAPERMLAEEVADAITNILSSNELRAPVFGNMSSLYIPEIPTAVKTGTTQKNRDAWTVGYTGDVVVGVWAGNNDGSYMNKVGGAGAAAPLWKKIVEYIYSEREGKEVGFTPPKPAQFPSYTSPVTGKGRLDGDFASIKDAEGYHSILYSTAKDAPRSGGNARDDVQFTSWESAVQSWARDNGLSALPLAPLSREVPDSGFDASLQYYKGPEIALVSPKGSRLSGERPTLLEAKFQSFASPILYISVSLEGKIIFYKKYSANEASFTQSVAINLYPPKEKAGQASPLVLEVMDDNEKLQKTTVPLFFDLE